jgi:hypothetical protein
MDKDKLKAFADKVFGDMAGAMTAGMGYIGVKTGLFRAMAGKGGMRVEDLARETKLVPRYVEEWLKGMTSAKYLDYDPATQTYRLPDEHAYLLASDDSDHFMGGLFPIVPVLLRLAPDVAVAFERGGGVPFEKFGSEGVFGLDVMNRGQYEHRLTGYWLKAMPDVQARLTAGGRALDVGCGAGRIAVTLAKAFPNAQVVGLDPDRESIRQAQAADKLEDNINPIATMLYGFSIFHCMTQSLAQGGPGLGTCMGPARTEQLLREAGFREFRQLDIKSPTNLFYAARP